MAVTEQPALSVDLDWESADGVRTDELRATWARLEMRVGDDVVTEVHDSASGSTRRSIYVPLYPIAEWIAFNWWHLRSDIRPSYLPARDWSFRSRLRLPAHRTSWLMHHNTRAVGEGFAWPDLTILPSASATHLVWQGDKNPPPGWRLRFLSSGEAEFAPTDVESALAGIVEAVLARLVDQGIHDTSLQEEWRALQTADVDEAEFCAAAARLGLDPYSVPDSVAELIEKSSIDLEGDLLDDFLDAADPSKLRADLGWIADVSDRIRSSSATTDAFPLLGQQSAPAVHPWELGLQDAREARDQLGLKVSERVDLEPWIATEDVQRVDRAFLGLGGTSGTDALVMGLADSRSPEGRRFAEARALWRHTRSTPAQSRFLVTSARTPTQQAERAFAAEFLAPAEAIKSFIPADDGAPVDLDDIAAASEHFGVNEWVVEYQIINQLGLEVDDPSLDR